MTSARLPFATPTERLATYFDTEQPRDTFEDREIDDVALLLEQCGHVASKCPRTYILLRTIGRLDTIDRLVKVGFSDQLFPVESRSLPSILEPSLKSSLVQHQSIILTKSLDLENGRHRHFAPEEVLPFDILGRLGSGGYGQVDRIVSKTSYRQFALKRIRRRAAFGNTSSREALRGFLNEMKIMRSLEHRHIVQYIGSYTDKSYLGLVMSPVAETDLATYTEALCAQYSTTQLERSQSPFYFQSQTSALEMVANLRTFFGCLTAALAYLHDQNIRHKDIKPQNILVSKGNVLFSDFGLSRDFGDDVGSTTSGVTPASARYCAPEVATYEARNTSSDIWSLGCVFLEMSAAMHGMNVSAIKTFFDNSSSQGTHYHANPSATAQIIRELETAGDSRYRRALTWIEKMVLVDRVARPTASQVLEMITMPEASDHDAAPNMFCGICCVPYLESDSMDSLADDFDNITAVLRRDPSPNKEARRRELSQTPELPPADTPKPVDPAKPRARPGHDIQSPSANRESHESVQLLATPQVKASSLSSYPQDRSKETLKKTPPSRRAHNIPETLSGVPIAPKSSQARNSSTNATNVTHPHSEDASADWYRTADTYAKNPNRTLPSGSPPLATEGSRGTVPPKSTAIHGDDRHSPRQRQSSVKLPPKEYVTAKQIGVAAVETPTIGVQFAEPQEKGEDDPAMSSSSNKKKDPKKNATPKVSEDTTKSVQKPHEANSSGSAAHSDTTNVSTTLTSPSVVGESLETSIASAASKKTISRENRRPNGPQEIEESPPSFERSPVDEKDSPQNSAQDVDPEIVNIFVQKLMKSGVKGPQIVKHNDFVMAYLRSARYPSTCPPRVVFGVPIWISTLYASMKRLLYEDFAIDAGISIRVPIVVAECCRQSLQLGLKSSLGFNNLTANNKIKLFEMEEIFDSGPKYGEAHKWKDRTSSQFGTTLFRYLRSLPEPLIPDYAAGRIMDVLSTANPKNDLQTAKDVFLALEDMPAPNHDTLLLLLVLLRRLGIDIHDMTRSISDFTSFFLAVTPAITEHGRKKIVKFLMENILVMRPPLSDIQKGKKPTTALEIAPSGEPMYPDVYATASSNWHGDFDGGLSFSRGDKVLILERTNSTADLWKGECNGRRGTFRATYVTPLPPGFVENSKHLLVPDSSSSPRSTKPTTTVNSLATPSSQEVQLPQDIPFAKEIMDTPMTITDDEATSDRVLKDAGKRTNSVPTLPPSSPNVVESSKHLSEDTSSSARSTKSTTRGESPATLSTPKIYLTARSDYYSNSPEDLFFDKGDKILLLKKTNNTSEPWTGEVNGLKGFFYANYVTLPFGFEKKSKHLLDPDASSKEDWEHHPMDGIEAHREAIFVTAEFDHFPRSKGHLSFEKGDQILLIQRTEDLRGWWKGYRGRAQGIFPAAYVALPPGFMNDSAHLVVDSKLIADLRPRTPPEPYRNLPRQIPASRARVEPTGIRKTLRNLFN